MEEWCGGTKYSFAGRSALECLALAFVSLAFVALVGVGCGTTTNAQFCDETAICPSGQECAENVCIDSEIVPDASPSCPITTHECVPNTPADWSGPMLKAALGDGEAFSACSGAEDSYVGGGSFVADGACECSCSTAEFVSCGTARMTAINGSALLCPGFACQVDQCVTQDLSPGVCTAMEPGMLSSDNVRMSSGTITGGSCFEGVLGPITPSADFDEFLALCPSETTNGDCGESAACALVAPEGYDQEQCIFRAGDHECPIDSGFTEKTTSFASLTDERSCGACDCELPAAGARCGGETRSCNINGVTQTPGCVSSSTWNVGATAFVYETDPADVDCSPVVANPALAGEVVGVDATTICCTSPTE